MCCLNQEHRYLSELFPYELSEKKGSDLEKGLKEYQFLLQAAAEAIESFQKIDLEKFDCVVGENACQIRAIKIALIALRNQDVFNDLIHQIETIKTNLESLLSPSSLQTQMRERKSLKDLIEEHHLDLPLSADEIFLVKSYILSEMKETDSDDEFVQAITRKDICVPDKLKEKYPHLSARFFSLLAKNLRTKISQASVHFVNSIAEEMAEPTLRKMLSEHTVEHNNLRCIPTFWTFKTLFLLAQNKKLPLLLHVKFLNHLGIGFEVIDEEYLFYKPCDNAKTYLPAKMTEEDLSQPACVIEGVICPKEGQAPTSKEEWIKTMSQNSIIDIMLAFAADHRQYPDPDKLVLIQDQEYEYYKQQAEKNGFSMNNPTTFFARHMYCSQVNKKVPFSSCL